MKIASLLSQHAGRAPSKPAVIYGDDVLTFGELERQSNRMANALLAKGLRQGDRVILYVGNSLELVVAIAALWKAGALPIPITTWTVGRELAFLVSDSKPFAVLYGPEQIAEVGITCDCTTASTSFNVQLPIRVSRWPGPMQATAAGGSAG